MNKKHTLISKIGYGLGDIPNGGAFALLTLLYLNFLVSIEGMNPALAGIVVMIARIWDAFTDPLMGMISDRMKSKFGRRRVFLLFGAPLLLITFILLWYSFGITNAFGKFIYYTMAYILFSTAIAITAVPYNALLPDMVDGYKERTGYITIRMFISNIAATIAVTMPAFILGPEAYRVAGDFLRMGIIFGLFFAIPLVLCFLMTWENPPQQKIALKSTGLVREFFASFKNQAFRQYLGIFVFGQVATDIGTAVTAFWLTDIMLRGDFLMVISGIVMVSGIAMLPVNNWLSKKYGKHFPTFVLMPLRIIALSIAFFMGENTSVLLLIATCILMGVGAGAASYVSWVILPDMPDTNELIHGVRNSGIFGAIATFARNFTSGISIFFVGLLLTIVGYEESVAGEMITQTPTALLGVRIIFAGVPIVLSIITAWLGWRFVLTKKNHELMRQAIDHKHAHGTPIQNKVVISTCEKISGHPFSNLWAGQAD